MTTFRIPPFLQNQSDNGTILVEWLARPEARLLSLSIATISTACAGFYPAKHWWAVGLIPSLGASLFHASRAVTLLSKQENESAKKEAFLVFAHTIAVFAWWHFSQAGNDNRNDFQEWLQQQQNLQTQNPPSNQYAIGWIE